MEGLSTLPTGWQNVPYDALFCAATGTSGATPDLTAISGPSVSGGIFGNPHSGATFVSGLHSSAAQGGVVFHEGIQQTVSGFTVGQGYSFSFYQAVIGQTNNTDPSGSWQVYAGTALIDTTAPTTTLLNVTDPSKPGSGWEERTITFTADAESITFSFMPFDDDVDIGSPNGLRMGIDSFSDIVAVPEPSVAALGLLAGLGLFGRRRA